MRNLCAFLSILLEPKTPLKKPKSLKKINRGSWVAQSVKCPTLDLNSGFDIRVVSSSPSLGAMLGAKPTN